MARDRGSISLSTRCVGGSEGGSEPTDRVRFETFSGCIREYKWGWRANPRRRATVPQRERPDRLAWPPPGPDQGPGGPPAPGTRVAGLDPSWVGPTPGLAPRGGTDDRSVHVLSPPSSQPRAPPARRIQVRRLRRSGRGPRADGLRRRRLRDADPAGVRARPGRIHAHGILGAEREGLVKSSLRSSGTLPSFPSVAADQPRSSR